MTKDDVDFEFGHTFPPARSSQTKSSKSRRSRARSKLEAVPKGAQYLIQQREIVCGEVKRIVHDFFCPSNRCTFTVKGSFNEEGGRRTMQTHLREDHRKRK